MADDVKAKGMGQQDNRSRTRVLLQREFVLNHRYVPGSCASSLSRQGWVNPPVNPSPTYPEPGGYICHGLAGAIPCVCNGGLQPALRAGLHPGHHQPAFRRVDRGVRIGTPHRRVVGPPHTPRPHPGDERRELPPPPQPAERRLPGLGRAGRPLSGPADPCS